LTIKRDARTPTARAMRAGLRKAVRSTPEADTVANRDERIAAALRHSTLTVQETDFGTYDPETAETRLYEARSSAPDSPAAETVTASADAPGLDHHERQSEPTETVALPLRRRPILVAAGALVLASAIVAAWWAFQSSSTALPTGIASVSTAPAAPAVPPGMVLVPGGTFTMGRDAAPDVAEGPARPVTLSAFLMDRSEVTNAAYAEFVRATGLPAPRHWKNGVYRLGEGDYPVVNVTWRDARAFAEWAGKRLPTEEEWEYAARGTDERLFPWGSNPSFVAAVTKEGGWKGPQPVGTCPEGVSPFGLADMYGNVWEWCESTFRPNPNSEYSPSARDAAIRMLRGGSFDSEQTGPRAVTVTTRSAQTQEYKDPRVGFRCAKSLPDATTSAP
jgi:serine/threonine-protein kinase